MTNVYPSPVKDIIRALIKGKHTKAVNFLCSRIGKKSVIADWMLAQGMYITGSKAPYEMYMKLEKHNLRSHLQNIKQDVLLLAGEKDHYVPRVQFERCKNGVHNARSLTTRMFLESEGGHQHCQIGNHTIATDYIMSWIDSKANDPVNS
jgi:dipeptidyl aminopeptidase/acylaminoacyl peptidase